MDDSSFFFSYFPPLFHTAEEVSLAYVRIKRKRKRESDWKISTADGSSISLIKQPTVPQFTSALARPGWGWWELKKIHARKFQIHYWRIWSHASAFSRVSSQPSTSRWVQGKQHCQLLYGSADVGPIHVKWGRPDPQDPAPSWSGRFVQHPKMKKFARIKTFIYFVDCPQNWCIPIFRKFNLESLLSGRGRCYLMIRRIWCACNRGISKLNISVLTKIEIYIKEFWMQNYKFVLELKKLIIMILPRRWNYDYEILVIFSFF